MKTIRFKLGVFSFQITGPSDILREDMLVYDVIYLISPIVSFSRIIREHDDDITIALRKLMLRRLELNYGMTADQLSAAVEKVD